MNNQLKDNSHLYNFSEWYKFVVEYQELHECIILPNEDYLGIDKFFDYRFGKLEYRSLSWITVKHEMDNFQGIPVVNYTDSQTPYTRILEHKWFDYQNQKGTIISYEYPSEYNGTNEPYYPIRDENNTQIFANYSELTKNLPKFIFGGRLGSYIYYDMHQIIAMALKLISQL